MLDALASALLLTRAERDHLHVLAQRDASRRLASTSDVQVFERLIDQFGSAPALVLNARWDVRAQNAQAEQLWGDWAGSPEPSNNLLYRFFTDPCFTEQLESWERHARLALCQFRAVFVRNLSDPGFPSLIQTLNAASPSFARWWERSDVESRDDGYKTFLHPKHGTIKFEYVVLRPATDDTVEVVVFMPRT